MSRQRHCRTLLHGRRILGTSAALALVASTGACDGDGVLPGRDGPDYAIGPVGLVTRGGLDDLSTVTFKVPVRNLGDGTGQGTIVAMYVDGRISQEISVQPLRSAGDTTVTFDWRAEAGTHEFLFGVDRLPAATPFVTEVGESNDVASLKLSITKPPVAVGGLSAGRASSGTVVDHPPQLSLASINERLCERCYPATWGPDLQKWNSWTYYLTATDDNGSVTYLSNRSWVIPCTGGSYTFSAKDNAGQVSSLTVTMTLPPSPVLTYLNACPHYQGGGG
jgi:hypothetical protein